MVLTVIIVSAGRPDILGRALSHLADQSRPPDEVIVSVPDESHVTRPTTTCYKLSVVHGARGCTAQRNSALDATDPSADIVVFFDDDFLPAHDYLAMVEQVLAAHPHSAALTGLVIEDGIKSPGLTFEAGLAILARDRLEKRPAMQVVRKPGAYGCNMAMRMGEIGDLRFDERLPLYGWQEDTDFSWRLAKGRPILQCDALRGVHLGVKNGRMNGVRFGYSQIVNPVYLVAKGSMRLRAAITLMLRNVAANLIRSVRPETFVDRRGRLRGNMLAIWHVLRGRVDPEHILRL